MLSATRVGVPTRVAPYSLTILNSDFAILLTAPL